MERSPLELGTMCLPGAVVACIAAKKLRHRRLAIAAKPTYETVTRERLAEVVTATVLFLGSGPSVILLNKYIMKQYSFHFPVVLASQGTLFLMVVSRACVCFGLVELECKRIDWPRYLRVVVLMSLFNFGTQSLGMNAYLFISVPVIQVLKSVTVVMTMIMSSVFLREAVSPLLAGSVVIIAVGTALSALFDEGHDTLVKHSRSSQALGFLICVTASTMEAGRTVCSQLLMDQLSVFDGIYWSSPAFTAVAAVFVAVFELRTLAQFAFTSGLVGLLLLNMFLTGLIVLGNFWFVKLFGALVSKVVNQAKLVGLVLASVLVFHEHCAPMQYVGYTVSLVGIGLFDEAKSALAEKKKSQQAQERQAAENSDEPGEETNLMSHPQEVNEIRPVVLGVGERAETPEAEPPPEVEAEDAGGAESG